MTVVLRVVLDQLVEATTPELASASRDVASALVRTAPPGCEVEALVPSGGSPSDVDASVRGLARIRTLGPRAAAMRSSWTLGAARGVGGGLVHSPTTVAPLARHDRVNRGDQVVATIWDATPWMGAADASAPGAASAAGGFLRRGSSAAWAKTLLTRLEKHADAVIVPTHAAAAWFEAETKLRGRVRVIGGAAPENFLAPPDSATRRERLGVPEGAVVVAGDADIDEVSEAAGGAPVVVLGRAASTEGGADERDAPRDVDGDPEAFGSEPAPGGATVIRLGPLVERDRAAVIAGAPVLVDATPGASFPWRVVEALALGVPVVAEASDIRHEILQEAGLTAPRDRVADAVRRTVADDTTRSKFAVRSADRGRGFSWRDHAERVWALHAEL